MVSMAYTTSNVCTHLVLGMCPCSSTKMHDVSSSTKTHDGCTSIKMHDVCSSSSSIKKRKRYEKAHAAARKRKCNDENKWKMIKKVLKESDIGNMSRFMIGKDIAEGSILPILDVDDNEIYKGVDVKFWDVDTKSMHSLVFKRWGSGSYVFINNWGTKFVARRGLKKGDEVSLQWNPLNNAFNFSVLQVNQA